MPMTLRIREDRSDEELSPCPAANAWREDLDRRIEQLLRLRNNLTDCIGCGCLTIGSCPLYNPYDKLASEGAVTAPTARRSG
jgi:MerR family redox-sensitive transcriptional activator SoxR